MRSMTDRHPEFLQNKKFCFMTLLFILLAGIVSDTAVRAADGTPSTWYVSVQGSDTNDGLSMEHPKRDLAAAIYAMGLGDTLIVMPGAYVLDNFRAWPKDPWKKKMYLNREGGSRSIRTTIKGLPGADRPFIRGSLQFNAAIGVTLEHLNIQGGIGYGQYMIYRDCLIGGPGVVYGVGAQHHHALIENNVFHDIRGESDAIGIYIHGHNNIIRGNVFRNIGHHGINSNRTKGADGPEPSKGWTIENNLITWIDGHGIGLQNVEDFTIRNNVLVNVGSQAISFGGNKFPDKNIRVRNNTIYNGSGKGYYGLFFPNRDIQNLTVENNIIVHRNPVAFPHPNIQLQGERMKSFTFRNNLYFNPYYGSGRIFEGNGHFTLAQWQAWTAERMGTAAGLESGSIVADPLVVSPPQNGNDYPAVDGSSHINLRLTAASPARDAGVSISDLNADITGAVRPQGTGFDMGAYEYAGNPSSELLPPEGLIVTPASPERLNLSWRPSPSAEATGYRVIRDGAPVADVAGLAYADAGLSPETAYAYTVRSLDAAGNESADSAAVTGVTLPAAVPLTPPKGLAITAFFSDRLKLDWTPSPHPDVVAYMVYRDGVFIAEINSPPFWDEGLAPETLYSYAVSAKDGSGAESELSPTVSGTTAAAFVPPTAPEGLEAISVTPTQAVLRWGGSDRPDLAAYILYRDGEAVAQTGETQAADAGLSPETAYQYAVSTLLTSGEESALSGALNVTTPAETPHDDATYYVSPEGDDASDGRTEATAWKDLGAAIYRMTLGDTLIVLPGDYMVVDFRTWPRNPWKEKMFLNRSGGDREIRTVIKGKEGAGRPVISAMKSDGSYGGLQFNGIIGLTLERLEIRGSVGYGDDIIYRDCVFGGKETGRGIHACHSRALIENCLFRDFRNGRGNIAISMHGNDNIIRNNRFENVKNYAVHSSAPGSSASSGWVIEGNRFWKTGGMKLCDLTDSTIKNNEFCNNYGNGIHLGGKRHDNARIRILHNTVYNAEKGGIGLFLACTVPELEFRNNILVHTRPINFAYADTQLTPAMLAGYGFSSNIYFNPLDAGAPVVWMKFGGMEKIGLDEWRALAEERTGKAFEAGSLAANPLVVESPMDRDAKPGTDADLRLAAGSPAVDAGLDLEDVTADLEGNARPAGAAADIGAWERVADEARAEAISGRADL